MSDTLMEFAGEFREVVDPVEGPVIISPYSREQRAAKKRILRALNDIWSAGIDIVLVEDGNNKKLKVTMRDEGLEGHWYGIEFDLNRNENNRIIRSRGE